MFLDQYLYTAYMEHMGREWYYNSERFTYKPIRRGQNGSVLYAVCRTLYMFNAMPIYQIGISRDTNSV